MGVGGGGGGRGFTHKRRPTDILPIFLRFALPLPCFSLSIREAFIRKNPEIVWRFANEGGGPTTKLFPFFDSPCLRINLFMEGKILFCIKDKQNNNNNNNS